MREGGRGREGEKERGRERGRGRRREGGRERVREGERERGREGEKERGREGESWGVDGSSEHVRRYLINVENWIVECAVDIGQFPA